MNVTVRECIGYKLELLKKGKQFPIPLGGINVFQSLSFFEFLTIHIKLRTTKELNVPIINIFIFNTTNCRLKYFAV